MQSTRLLRRSFLAAALAGIAAATTAAGPVFAEVQTGSISGIVRDGTGAAIADATITIYVTSPNPVKQQQTDAQGRFNITGLKFGNYKVEIGMQGWSEWAPGGVDDEDQARIYQVTARRNAVADSVVTTAGVITGQILAPDGKPAANTNVSATNVDTIAVHETRTAADGTYRVRVQPNQTFDVSYSVGPRFEYVPHTFDPAEAAQFFVGAGQTIRVDDQAVALSGITGRVTGAAGAPARNVTVRAINDDTAYEAVTTTRADGTYDLSSQLEPGKYKVRFVASGRSQYAHQKLDYNSADVVTLTLGKTPSSTTSCSGFRRRNTYKLK